MGTEGQVNAVVAHSMLGTIAAAKGAIQTVLAHDLDSGTIESLLLMAVRRLDASRSDRDETPAADPSPLVRAERLRRSGLDGGSKSFRDWATTVMGDADPFLQQAARYGLGKSVGRLPEAWLMAGGPHHTVLSQAVGTEELTDFARIIGVELLVIDDTTNRRDFGNEIRWNSAASRLGLGF